jgi:hypothetical protein
MTQLRNQGIMEYVKDIWNLADQLHIWFGLSSSIMQIIFTSEPSIKNEKIEKIFLIIVAILMLIKTFFFLRVFSSLSYIVTVMRNVFYDLRVFLLFYIILIFMFSNVISILQIGNFEASNDP